MLEVRGSSDAASRDTVIVTRDSDAVAAVLIKQRDLTRVMVTRDLNTRCTADKDPFSQYLRPFVSVSS